MLLLFEEYQAVSSQKIKNRHLKMKQLEESQTVENALRTKKNRS